MAFVVAGELRAGNVVPTIISPSSGDRNDPPLMNSNLDGDAAAVTDPKLFEVVSVLCHAVVSVSFRAAYVE